MVVLLSGFPDMAAMPGEFVFPQCNTHRGALGHRGSLLTSAGVPRNRESSDYARNSESESGESYNVFLCHKWYDGP